MDLNCDMGEGFGNYSMPDDEVLMAFITSANIACGFHAGDPGVMEKTVKLAIKNNVAIGAHPGLQDLQGFGRREMTISPREVYQICLYQIGALGAFVRASGGVLHHVKAHGALYNMAARDKGLADALSQAVFDFDPALILYGLSGSEMIASAKRFGLSTASEVFADRTYQDNGLLTPRNHENSMIKNEEQAIDQVMKMVMSQQVVSTNQNTIELVAETVCLHGDGDHAVAFAKKINHALRSQGIELKTL